MFLTMRTLFNSMIANAVRAAVMDDATDAVGANEIANLAVQADTPDTDEQTTERKARLQAQEAMATKEAAESAQTPKEVLDLAKAEILICWEEYAGIGGVYDLQKQAKGKLRNIAQHVLTIARECAAAAYRSIEGKPDLAYETVASSMFRNAMAMAELNLRGSLDLTKPEMEAKLDSFIGGSWSIYRGQIRSAIDVGVDPRDHESIYSVTKARDQTKEATKQATTTGTRQDDKAATQTNEDAAANAQKPAEANSASDVAEAIREAAAKDADKDDEAVGLGWSELEAITQKNGKVQAALILLHRAIHSVDLKVDTNEERVLNSLRLAAREINKLTRRETMEEMSELEDDVGESAAESLMAKAVREDQEEHQTEPEAVEA